MLACAVIVVTVATISSLRELPSTCSVAVILAIHLVMGGVGRCWSVPDSMVRLWCYIALALAAALWSVSWGHNALENRLSEEQEGSPLQVLGTVASLPVRSERGLSFVLQVDAAHSLTASGDVVDRPLTDFPERIRLNWYADVELKAGMRLLLRVKLKRPHGNVNLGGFDYEAWLLSRGIGATGYVRNWAGNRVIAERSTRLSMHRLRQDLRDRIVKEAPVPGHTALAVALITGDKSLIAQQQREQLQALGLAHLLAISGLHIGLAAGVGLLFGQLAGRCANALFPMCCFTPTITMICAWIFAAAYALLAGLSLPTQRALLMLTVWVLVSVSGRRFSPWLSWWLALAVVFWCFPLSLYDLGVWLSFGAVAILIASFQARWLASRSRWRELLWAQLVLFVALGVLQWFAGLPVSLVSPLVNFLVIPYVGLIVVPALLLLAGMALVSEGLFEWLLSHALLPLEFLVWLLERFEWAVLMLGGWEVWQWQRVGAVPVSIQILVCLTLLLLFSPLPRLLKLLALLSGVSLFYPHERIAQGIEVVVLDVGQGLAVAIHAQGANYLVDVGRDFHVSRVLMPYFRQRGITRLDHVVISHGDADHAGGLRPMLEAMPVDAISVQRNDAERWIPGYIDSGNLSPGCRGQQTSRWGVLRVSRFGVGKRTFNNTNNRSCVLLLEYAGVRILLPGDIEWGREQQLLLDPQLSEPVDILVAPHHGSRTSSGAAWVQQLKPRWVVFSAGYRNRYGHPAPEVVDRYLDAGSAVLNTARSGAVHFSISPSGEVVSDAARNLRKRYWM